MITAIEHKTVLNLILNYGWGLVSQAQTPVTFDPRLTQKSKKMLQRIPAMTSVFMAVLCQTLSSKNSVFNNQYLA